METGQRTTVYYRAEVNGRVMLVDSLDRLPPEARARAERIALGTNIEPNQPDLGADSLLTQPGSSAEQTPVSSAVTTAEPLAPARPLGSAQVTVPHGALTATHPPATDPAASGAQPPTGFQLDLASFGLGLVSGLVVATLLALSRRSSSQGGLGRWVVRSALVACVVMIAAGSYLGWVRRFAGVGNEGLVGPGRLVQDARDVVEQAQKRREAQLEELREAEKLAK